MKREDGDVDQRLEPFFGLSIVQRRGVRVPFRWRDPRAEAVPGIHLPDELVGPSLPIEEHAAILHAEVFRSPAHRVAEDPSGLPAQRVLEKPAIHQLAVVAETQFPDREIGLLAHDGEVLAEA